ncbi:MAG: EthD family reductase [Candidatus Roseilinea sp.]|uniref:EthD family reductase n=1 Tax=Candidatus Roseilinea sp. TaxID=2838777 RepID=UPI00404B3237
MIKLITFFRRPADVNAFEDFFAQHYVPAVNAIPNVRQTTVSRAAGAPSGDPPYYLIHELYFDSPAELTQALNSNEGRNAGALLLSFAQPLVSVMYAEVWEDKH